MKRLAPALEFMVQALEDEAPRVARRLLLAVTFLLGTMSLLSRWL